MTDRVERHCRVRRAYDVGDWCRANWGEQWYLEGNRNERWLEGAKALSKPYAKLHRANAAAASTENRPSDPQIRIMVIDNRESSETNLWYWTEESDAALPRVLRRAFRRRTNFMHIDVDDAICLTRSGLVSTQVDDPCETFAPATEYLDEKMMSNGPDSEANLYNNKLPTAAPTHVIGLITS